MLDKILDIFDNQLLLRPTYNSFVCWTNALIELEWDKWVLNQATLNKLIALLNRFIEKSNKVYGFFHRFAITIPGDVLAQVATFYSRILTRSQLDLSKMFDPSDYLIFVFKIYLLLPLSDNSITPLFDILLEKRHTLNYALSNFDQSTFETLLSKCSVLLYSNFGNFGQV